MYRNIMITPKGEVDIETHPERPYFHSKYFKLDGPPHKLGVVLDLEIPDGGFIHMRDMPEGTYILILQKF